LIPTAIDFEKALKEIKNTDLQMNMLERHYQSPSFTITATEMANALGYPHYSVSNGNYGKLGSLLGDALGWQPKDSIHKVSVLVEFAKPENHWQWIMRPQLVSALEKLGWVNPSSKSLPEEVSEIETHIEGAVKTITINSYERDQKARTKCIEQIQHMIKDCEQAH
jgi:predicted HNH restriction endonuclease